MFQKIWDSKKNYNNRAVSRFSVEIFCVTLMKTYWGNPSRFQKCSDIIEILDNKGTTILSNFLASQWQIILWGTLLCFRNFLVRKKTWIGGGGGYHVLPWEIFCVTLPKKIIGKSLGVSEILGFRKDLFIRRSLRYTVGNVFVSFHRKTSWGTLLCLTQFRVSKKFLHEVNVTIFSQGGVSTIFPRLFYVSQCRNVRRGTC